MTQLLWSSAKVVFGRELKVTPGKEDGTPAGEMFCGQGSTFYTPSLQVMCTLMAPVYPVHVSGRYTKCPLRDEKRLHREVREHTQNHSEPVLLTTGPLAFLNRTRFLMGPPLRGFYIRTSGPSFCALCPL